MSWVLIYLVTGVGVLVGMFLLNKWRTRDAQNSSLPPTVSMHRSTWEWFVDKVLAPTVAISAVVCAWPAVVILAIKEGLADELRDKENQKLQEESAFRIRKSDLKFATTVADVEEMHRIEDPLGAVPDAPFGHLNSLWTEFLQQRPDGAELWTFACDWKAEWDVVFSRRGYVWVKGKACTPWMLTCDALKDGQDE